MAIVQYLKQTVAREGTPRELFECRSCGTSVETEDDTCPTCGSTDVASYELD